MGFAKNRVKPTQEATTKRGWQISKDLSSWIQLYLKPLNFVVTQVLSTFAAKAGLSHFLEEAFQIQFSQPIPFSLHKCP